jgi:hypothetical protein
VVERDDRFKRSALAIRDHRFPRSHRLDRYDSEVLFAGKDEGPAACISRAHFLVGLLPEQLDGGAREPPQPGFVLTGPDHLQRTA